MKNIKTVIAILTILFISTKVFSQGMMPHSPLDVTLLKEWKEPENLKLMK